MKQQAFESNPVLLNAITPVGMEFARTHCVIGENKARLYAAIKYPPHIEIGWLAQITNTPNTIVSFEFEPVDNSALLENLSRGITQSRGTADSTKDPLTRQRALKSAEDGERLMQEIDQMGASIGYLTMLLMPHARGDEAFELAAKRMESLFKAKGIKVRALANLQREALLSIMPYGEKHTRIGEISRILMPIKALLGGFPISSTGYNDGSSYYFAKDMNHGLVMLDPWKRGGDRTNSNMVIMGKAGQGKSTAVKHILMNELARGSVVLALDPERELKIITQRLDGAWINAAGSDSGRINPLQIRPVPKDDEDSETNGNGLGPLALHMQTLDTFHGLYIPSLTHGQKVFLKKTLEELYARFGFFWDTDVTAIPNEHYPTYKNLYDLLLEKSAEYINLRQEGNQDGGVNPYWELSYLFREIAEGADSHLFNGHTTLDAKNQWICLDTYDLQNAPDNIKKACYFNVLSWCWERMSRNRNERVFFSADEAYLLIDPNVPQSLVFLRNIMKRCRKYEAAVAIISHSVVDFLDPSIRMYGQALLDIPNIKVILGTDGRNLKDTADLFDLTESEQSVLYSQAMGHGLLMIGSRKMHVHFELSKKRLELIEAKAG